MMNGYKDPKCNSCIKASYKGKQVVVKIVDTCPGCQKTSLDLSPAAFNKLEHPDVGLLDITWEFVSCDSASNNASPSKKADPPKAVKDASPAENDVKNAAGVKKADPPKAMNNAPSVNVVMKADTAKPTVITNPSLAKVDKTVYNANVANAAKIKKCTKPTAKTTKDEILPKYLIVAY
jgi:rare lipoprotein A (peptidoglycan hydrolase)